MTVVRVDFLRVALIRVDIVSQSTTIPVWPWSGKCHNVEQFHRLKYNSYCVKDRDGIMYTETVTLSSLDFTLVCSIWCVQKRYCTPQFRANTCYTIVFHAHTHTHTTHPLSHKSVLVFHTEGGEPGISHP